MNDSHPSVLGVLRRNWGWLLAWGAALEILGLIGLGYLFAVSAVTTVFLGAMLVAYGVVEVVHAFRHQGWSGFFLFFFGGLASIAAGAILWWNPLGGMAVLTLFAAMYFIAVGVIRSLGALSTRHPGWGWGLVNGLVSVVLGILVWRGWPASSFWVIGLFVCIDMVFRGWNYIMLALLARRMPGPAGA